MDLVLLQTLGYCLRGMSVHSRLVLNLPRPDVPKGGAVGPLGGGGGLEARVVCARDIFILNKIWAQDKMYIW
jgi:hypothetical protein